VNAISLKTDRDNEGLGERLAVGRAGRSCAWWGALLLVFDTYIHVSNTTRTPAKFAQLGALTRAHPRIYRHSLMLEGARAYAAQGRRSLVGRILEIHQELLARIYIVLIRPSVGF